MGEQKGVPHGRVATVSISRLNISKLLEETVLNALTTMK